MFIFKFVPATVDGAGVVVPVSQRLTIGFSLLEAEKTISIGIFRGLNRKLSLYHICYIRNANPT
jgi:hypothetical protein